MDEGAVSIAEPFLVVDPDDDRLISQLSEFVAGHDARAQGVRPVFPGSGSHPRLRRGRLEVAGREIVEDRHPEQMRGRLRRLDVPTPETEDEADFRFVVHLGGQDEPRRLSLERLETHRRDRLLGPDDVQRISVVIGRQHVPFRRRQCHRGQVHAPVPTVPRADRRSEAWGPSSGGKADELHATLPRFERRTDLLSGRPGSPSRHAEGDSQPSPAGWACGMFSDQLRTYSGSRYANPAFVIRMLSKYVSSMTARRACTFPRAVRDRCAAFPWGLCGVDPGWNVNEPSSITPSRAP